MAKPKFRDERFDSRPMQYSDLSPEQQGAADSLVSEHLKSLPDKMTNTATNLRKQAAGTSKQAAATTKLAKAARLESAATTASQGSTTLDEAAANRVHYVERAATDLRMPGEHFAGMGWYYDAHQKINDAVGDHEHATNVSSALSPGQSPENERASAAGLITAHRGGSVNFTPTLVKTLKKSGADVPEHLHRQSVPFKDIPSHLIPHLVDPKHATHVEKNSTGVPWSEIKKVSLPNTIQKGHRILTGELETAFDPTQAPKTWSYEHRIASAVPESDEHFEYRLRGADLASKIRGENSIGQQMFDYVGLRHSNEGGLSNSAHTAEDTWQQTISSNLPDRKTMKAAGDVAMTAKTHNGVSVSPDARIGSTAVRHAWENEATQRASRALQDKYQTEYTVPSMMVQETGWTAVRRHALIAKGTKNEVTADQAYNEHLKSQRDEAATQAKADTSRSKQFQQVELDLGDWR